MTDGSTDKRSESTESSSKKESKAEWVAAQKFNAELHKKDVEFKPGEDIPGNVAQETIDRWKDRGLIKKA